MLSRTIAAPTLAAVPADEQRALDERGFVVLRGLFPPDAARALRAEVAALARAAHGDDDPRRPLDCWEGVTRHAAFWPVIEHPPLVARLRALVGPDVRYLHNSEVHAHNAGLLWHRDCIDQRRGAGPDWDDGAARYRIVRACIYLQTGQESGFRLGVVPGSHRAGRRTVAGWALDAAATAQRRLRLRRGWDPRRRRLPQITLAPGWRAPLVSARPHWIDVGLGDCVVIHQRLLHSASPVFGPQYALYLSYGPDDVHAARLLRFHRHEQPRRPHLPPAPALARRLAAAGLLRAAEVP